MKWLLFLLILNSYAQEFVVEDIDVLPQGSTLDAWTEDLFRHDQLLFIRNKEFFFADLHDKFPEHSKSIILLEQSFTNKLEPSQYGFISSFHNSRGFVGYVELLPDIRSQIPVEMMNYIQTYEYRINQGPPFFRATNREELINTVNKWNISQKAKQKLISEAIDVFGTIIPMSRDNWDLFPLEVRKQHIKNIVDIDSPARKAVNIEVTIKSSEEAKSIAHQFAAGRNPLAIEKFLLSKLEKNNGAPLKIDLHEILPVFVRKQMNQYDLDGGPNCFNSGICVNRGNHYETEFTDAKKLGTTLDRDYLKLTDDTKLLPGDLMLYTDEFGNPIHVATYITDEIVFTKNGINKFSPYIFQRLENMEMTYGASRLKLVTYRPQAENGRYKTITTPKKSLSGCLSKLIK